MKEEKSIEEIVDEVTICREYDGDTFCYCTPEEVEKLLTHERTLREEAVKAERERIMGYIRGAYMLPRGTTPFEVLRHLTTALTPTDNHADV